MITDRRPEWADWLDMGTSGVGACVILALTDTAFAIAAGERARRQGAFVAADWWTGPLGQPLPTSDHRYCDLDELASASGLVPLGRHASLQGLSAKWDTSAKVYALGCPARRTVLMQRQERAMGEAYFACEKKSCPVCGPVYRRRLLGEVLRVMGDDQLLRLDVPAAAWESTRRSLSRRRAAFLSLRTGDTVVVLNISGSGDVVPAEDIDALWVLSVDIVGRTSRSDGWKRRLADAVAESLSTTTAGADSDGFRPRPLRRELSPNAFAANLTTSGRARSADGTIPTESFFDEAWGQEQALLGVARNREEQKRQQAARKSRSRFKAPVRAETDGVPPESIEPVATPFRRGRPGGGKGDPGTTA